MRFPVEVGRRAPAGIWDFGLQCPSSSQMAPRRHVDPNKFCQSHQIPTLHIDRIVHRSIWGLLLCLFKFVPGLCTAQMPLGAYTDPGTIESWMGEDRCVAAADSVSYRSQQAGEDGHTRSPRRISVDRRPIG